MRRLSAAAFDTLIVALSALLVFGGYLLVWADNNSLIVGNQIFSVWALPLYAGFLVAAYLLFIWWGSRRAGGREAFARAYRYSLIGAALFVVGLLIEFVLRAAGGRPPAGPEGVLVPSRLLLFAATLLIVTGPILSIVQRRAAKSGTGRALTISDRWRDGALTLAVGLGLVLAVLTLLTETIHPFVVLAGATDPNAGRVQTPTDLYMIPVDGGGSRRLTTTPELYEVHPDVSADGRTVAYAGGQPDNFRLFTLDLASGQTARVTDAAQNEDGPVWASDGRQLSYWSPVAQQSLPAATPVGPGPAPAPSANTVPQAVSRAGLGIWFVTPGQPGSAHMWDGAGGEGIESWSPTGDRYCGWAIENGSFDVVTWDATSHARASVVAGAGDAWGCSWSPDGSRLAWHSDASGNFEVYSGAPDGSDVRQLTNETEVDQLPRWSPDGSQIAWISTYSGDFDIWVANADGSSPRNITNDPALDDGFYGFAWLPDGSAIVAASSGRRVPAQISSESVPLGEGSLALEVILLAGTLVFALRLTQSVPGIATVVSLVDALLLTLITPEPLLSLAVVAGGVAADVGAWVGRRRPNPSYAAALAGVLSAMVFVTVYFVALGIVRGLAWDLELVVGTVMLAGLLGFVTSIAIRPPLPEVAEEG